MSEPKRQDDSRSGDADHSSGHGAVLGVLFAIALTGLAIWLVQQMHDSASMLNCAFTKDPKCRAMIRD